MSGFRILAVFGMAVFCAGAVASEGIVINMPSLDDNTYKAPDGSVWVSLHRETSQDQTGVIFSPEGSKPDSWKESLQFYRSKRDWTADQIRKVYTTLLREEDPSMKFDIQEPEANVIILIYDAPRWKEKGAQKIIRMPDRYLIVGYINRLGPDGDSQFKHWKQIIEEAQLRSSP